MRCAAVFSLRQTRTRLSRTSHGLKPALAMLVALVEHVANQIAVLFRAHLLTLQDEQKVAQTPLEQALERERACANDWASSVGSYEKSVEQSVAGLRVTLDQMYQATHGAELTLLTDALRLVDKLVDKAEARLRKREPLRAIAAVQQLDHNLASALATVPTLRLHTNVSKLIEHLRKCNETLQLATATWIQAMTQIARTLQRAADLEPLLPTQSERRPKSHLDLFWRPNWLPTLLQHL